MSDGARPSAARAVPIYPILAVNFVGTLGFGIVLAIYAGAALLALGNGLAWPSLQAVLSGAAAADVQGAVQGLASSGGAIASIVGLVAGGLLFNAMGARIFLVAALTTGVVGLLALRIARPEAARA